MRNKKTGAADGRQPGHVHDLDTAYITPEGTAIQRRRLYAYMRAMGSCTTLEARQVLDILHPAGRVFDLRRRGVNIATVQTTAPTLRKGKRRIARYVLLPGGEALS